jgi:hypothetical protein
MSLVNVSPELARVEGCRACQGEPWERTQMQGKIRALVR